MGTVYLRTDIGRLCLGYKNAQGKWRYKITKLVPGQEAIAKRLLEKLEAQASAQLATGLVEDGPITFDRFQQVWVQQRIRNGLTSAKDDSGRLTYAVKAFGYLLLEDVRPRHVRGMVKSLRDEGRLAPKTIRNIHGTLHRLFEDAAADELVPSNPCVLKRGDLPPDQDADLDWRETAIYQRHEVEMLIEDERIPEDRRVYYAVLFLGATRAGEASALTWMDYDASIEPLGRLNIRRSYNTRHHMVKGTKTGVQRRMPVHPVLAKLLAQWKLSGWAAMFGRVPGPEDLILPLPGAPTAFRNAHYTLEKIYLDCDALGIRRRRQHDARRTFISLAQADGARKEILKWVTHGHKVRRRSDIMDVYTTLPWGTLCSEVQLLKIKGLDKRLTTGLLQAIGKLENHE